MKKTVIFNKSEKYRGNRHYQIHGFDRNCQKSGQKGVKKGSFLGI